MSFNKILEKYRKTSLSQHEKGIRFEKLMQAYLQTDPMYTGQFKKIWLWNEFPGKNDLGKIDTGIDLVAFTYEGEYWAIQCKCYQDNILIDKPEVDTFLSTSSREFRNDQFQIVRFSQRLWISTTNKWSTNATEAIKNQNPPVTRINLYDLQEAPIDWEKLDQGIIGDASLSKHRDLKPHQKEALQKTNDYFKTADRGKLIMACGTGKTFATLRIAENETNHSGLILFLVPSIALIGQTLREWTTYAKEPINPICICSDPKVSQKRKNYDTVNFSTIDLALPASTDVNDIIRQLKYIKSANKAGITVIFSTYQSIDVTARVQKELLNNKESFGEFDLIICDEAHRTTGVTIVEEESSSFVKIHDNNFIKGKKRLYMTATPRLYSDDAKDKAAKADAILCSMDDKKLYGEEIYRIGFGESVERDLLTDYKVLILTLNEDDITPAMQKILSDEDNEIDSNDVSKLIGCINALSKQILGDQGILKSTDPEPMRRAVAFCQSIAASKKITDTFNKTSEEYVNMLPVAKKEKMVDLYSKHIDGTMTAPDRDELMGWLKADMCDPNECRVLTNVRCLSEGVDVPSLDAVMFLSARNSQVDVVQSVGRVMRKAEGKKYGYIIIPVVVPSDIEPNKALDDNERYKVVWTVLNALRAHDDRFNATVNKIDLNKYKPDQIIVGQTDPTGEGDDTKIDPKSGSDFGTQTKLYFEDIQNAIFAKMVQKVGDRRYWEQWAKSVAEIAERQGERINRLIKEDVTHENVFKDFLAGLKKNINPSITQQEAVDMLSQHIITKPVFEALFEGYSFVKNNPISVSMQKMLDLLEAQSIEKDTQTLQNFYESVKLRASGIDNAEGKQHIIIELYDKFFKTAFPKMVEKLGIVYTPIEVVDFIINSVNDVLKKEFDRTISDENIHLLDPFTGTGTFITRLLQSKLIRKIDLVRKYQQEIHANEIVLLAYYIAAVNIENAFHDAMSESDYLSFDGVCLTDTFQLGETDESEKLFSEMFPQNSARVVKQKNATLRVIIGNPPYSVGQKSANDNAQNQNYTKLDSRIAKTYAAETNATNKNSLYDSYIKAFRWSTDRLDPIHGGIVCFISNGAWLDGNSTNGFRKCLEKEFSLIYVFNLKGNARTQGELRRKEAGNIFGGGSRTPIAITLLVKNPKYKELKANIYYHDIGDYLNREEKLAIVKKFHSVMNEAMQWEKLTPNEHGDWISQRNNLFEMFIPIGDKDDKNNNNIFLPFYSNGVKTQRDAWCYNFSKIKLEERIRSTIDYYNEQRKAYEKVKKGNSKLKVNDFISFDATKFSWSDYTINGLENNNIYSFESNSMTVGFYRPFFKQNLYFNRTLNERVYKTLKLFPTSSTKNIVICVSGVGASKDFSCLITDCVPDVQIQFNGQCFPLYYYEEREKKQKTLFDEAGDSDFIRRDGISNFILTQAQKRYGKKVGKEDIFYYVYGFLHNPEYRTMFANDFKKMLPRLPLVEDVKDFWEFSKAGRELAELHINYETVPSYKGIMVKGENSGFYKVEKMRFPKKDQKETIIYNSKIIIENIPQKAYDYVVNGKSAIEWIMERYQITTHKESGIINDPNDWTEEVGNSKYILDLLLSIINVSVKTMDIVDSLPKVKFE